MIVGLTGGIGSGKSVLADLLGELGAAVVDTDAIAHELTAPHGPAMAAIRQAFGDTVVATDGGLDRVAMRQLAFTTPAARRALEAILHPLIRVESERRCRAALARGAPYALLVVPLLVESGDFRQRVDRIAVVDCDDQTRLARVVARNGLAVAEVERIMATQASRAARLAAADDVVANDSNLMTLRRRAEELHRQYLALAARQASGLPPDESQLPNS